MNIKLLLTSGFIVVSLASSAQSNKAYAVTGDGNNDFTWMNIREVDLSTGQVTKTLFQRSKSNYLLTDVNTKKSVDQTATANVFGSRDYPTATMVAAAAYDKNSNKLFFAPMRMGELRWMETNVKNETPRFYTISSEVLKVATDPRDEANNLTRMVIGADGNGYAVSNDGNHLIKFTTGKTPVITDLGNLVDAESNKGLSVHNKCSSWGGDMLADAFGKLYIISANHQVYVVDIATRIATHQGAITGLPAGYTTNAAAVNNDGDIVITSANKFDGYYKLKLSDLAAVKIEGSDIKYNASDLAGSNLLLQKEADAASKFSMADSKIAPIANSSDSKVFPNPITTNTFSVLFDGKKEGAYTIVLSDLAGRTIQSRSITINKSIQTVNVNIATRPAKGMYMVNVLDANRQTILTEKVMIQ
ncbi:MAG: T9SS type A sorting domain-containing protein [Ferruginibacter sp.]